MSMQFSITLRNFHRLLNERQNQTQFDGFMMLATTGSVETIRLMMVRYRSVVNLIVIASSENFDGLSSSTFFLLLEVPPRDFEKLH